MGRGELCLQAALAAVLFPSVTIAAISAGFESDLNSRYVWRGLVQDENPVIQPSVWGSLGNLTLEVWSNWPTRQETGKVLPAEVDFSLEYPLAAAGFDVLPAAALWWYPAETETPLTGELSLRLSRAVGPISAFSTHSLDIVASPGAYYGGFGAEWERELLPGLDATVSVGAGWASSEFNATYAGLERWALNVVEAEAAATWQVLQFFYLRPHFAVSALVDAGLRAAATRPAAMVFGLAAGCGL